MADRLRVLMTADTVGGVWQYALELVRALAPHGVEVALASMGARLSPAQRAELQALDNVELHESDYRLCWMDEPWSDVEAASGWLLDLASKFRPDLVHLNDLGHGHLSWPAPVLMVGHSCVHSWWQAVHGTAPPAEFERYRSHVVASLRAVDLMVAPSASMGRSLQAHYGPLPPNRVIANGRRASEWPAGAKRPVIFAAGRIWDEAKNLGMLAAVAPRLPWPVCIAGDNRSPDDRSTTLASVRLPGPLGRAALAHELQHAAIYALPARYEPFGLSVLEAAHAGCALVLGDIPSLREIWEDAAVYVQPEDVDALEATLRRLIDTPHLRERLGDRARLRAQRYTPERMALGYLDAYRQLLQPGRLATADGEPRVVRHAPAPPAEDALQP